MVEDAGEAKHEERGDDEKTVANAQPKKEDCYRAAHHRPADDSFIGILAAWQLFDLMIVGHFSRPPRYLTGSDTTASTINSALNFLQTLFSKQHLCLSKKRTYLLWSHSYAKT